MHAVAEAARKVACAGATPIGATNCLNFGNPEKPHIMWQFSQVIDGITKACEELDTPITGGNVSFYNETLGEGIYPTPVIGVVGILEDVHKAAKMHFSPSGAAKIVLLRAKNWETRSMPNRNSARPNTPKKFSEQCGVILRRLISRRKRRYNGRSSPDSGRTDRISARLCRWRIGRGAGRIGTAGGDRAARKVG